MAVIGRNFPVVSALLLAASSLGAQAPAKPTCQAAESGKGNAARATLMINVARQSQGAAASNLKSAIKLVEKVDKGDDPVTYAYVLGSAISLMGNEKGIGLTPKRGDLGFITDPNATLDLPATLDSLFKIVEKAQPACTEFTSYWRAGQKFYLDLVNGAINALNAEKLDSAEYYAKQANTLYAASPYGTMILGNVASRRNNTAQALEFWSAAAEAANSDSSYRDVRRQMLGNIGGVYLTQANTLTGAEKTAAARKAAETYTQLIAVPATKGAYLSIGRQNQQAAFMLAGDTASAAKSWGELIANPGTYEYGDLLNSAVNAARASRSADAAKLFEATLAQNPNSRDALYNLAVTYLSLEQNEKVGPIVTRLVAVDPGNPENYNLAARAYLALAKAADKAKKSAIAAAYNDTTLTWYNTGNKLPVEVTFAEFSPSDKQVVIGGTVIDRRDKVDADANAQPAPTAKGSKVKQAAKPAPKTYPAKPVTLVFSALDKTGAVLGTHSVTTEALTPGKAAKFSVTVAGGGVVAYKYTISE